MLQNNTFAPLLRMLMALLATYRVVNLLVHEDGPNDVFYHIRKAAGVYELAAEDRPELADLNPPRPKGIFGRILYCEKCTGVYVGAFFAWLTLYPSKAGDLLITSMALATGEIQLRTRE